MLLIAAITLALVAASSALPFPFTPFPSGNTLSRSYFTPEVGDFSIPHGRTKQPRDSFDTESPLTVVLVFSPHPPSERRGFQELRQLRSTKHHRVTQYRTSPRAVRTGFKEFRQFRPAQRHCLAGYFPPPNAVRERLKKLRQLRPAEHCRCPQHQRVKLDRPSRRCR